MMMAGYFITDLKADNLMFRKNVIQNHMKDNETVQLDLSGFVKFTNGFKKAITDPHQFKYEKMKNIATAEYLSPYIYFLPWIFIDDVSHYISNYVEPTELTKKLWEGKLDLEKEGKKELIIKHF